MVLAISAASPVPEGRQPATVKVNSMWRWLPLASNRGSTYTWIFWIRWEDGVACGCVCTHVCVLCFGVSVCALCVCISGRSSVLILPLRGISGPMDGHWHTSETKHLSELALTPAASNEDNPSSFICLQVHVLRDTMGYCRESRKRQEPLIRIISRMSLSLCRIWGAGADS